jgi:DNA-binding transcriptional ArsR family regulator
MRPSRQHDVFDAIAHPVRRQLLTMLKEGPLPAGTLADAFEMSLPAVSQHLKLLREASLVKEERQGRLIIYHLSPIPLKSIHEWAEGFGDFWNGKLDALEAHLDRKYGTKPPT